MAIPIDICVIISVIFQLSPPLPGFASTAVAIYSAWFPNRANGKAFMLVST